MNTTLLHPGLNPGETEAIKREWTAAVEALFQQITGWATESGWQVSRSETDVTEKRFGTYRLPVLTLSTPGLPEDDIVLEPQAVNAGGKGRVKMYASNTLYRVRLLPGADDAAGWTVLTDSGIPLHSPWNRETFTTLVKDLLGAS